MFYSSLEKGYGKARDPDANRSRQYARHSAGRGTGRICSVKLEIPCQECVKPERLSQIRNMYALPPPRTEPADAPANKKRQRACILQKNFIKSSKCDYGFQSYQIEFFQNISLTLCQSLQI